MLSSSTLIQTIVISHLNQSQRPTVDFPPDILATLNFFSPVSTRRIFSKQICLYFLFNNIKELTFRHKTKMKILICLCLIAILGIFLPFSLDTSYIIFPFNIDDPKFLVKFQFFKGACFIAPHGFCLHEESLLILYNIFQGLPQGNKSLTHSSQTLGFLYCRFSHNGIPYINVNNSIFSAHLFL